MALAFEKYALSVRIADAGGNVASMHFRISALTVGTASTTAASVAAEVAALTNGAVVGYTFSVIYTEDAAYFGDAGSQIENIAQVNFRLAQSATPDGPIGKWGALRIPAPVDAMFLDTSGPLYNTVNPAYAALQTLLARYDGNLTYTMTTSDGQLAEDVTVGGNVNGHRIHRKSTRG
jgi:hypothetical protein